MSEVISGTLDKPTLDTLRMVYKPSAKIVAVKVAGIQEGKVGYVKRVLTNGNIQVVWETGGESEIIYGAESVRKVEDGLCILGHKEEIDGGCDGAFCDNCGWNRLVANERLKQIREGGLTESRDGTKYLRLKRNGQKNVRAIK